MRIIFALSLLCCSASERIEMSYLDVEIRNFLRDIGEYTNMSFVVDPDVEGKVTFVSSASIGSSDFNDVFTEMLSSLGIVSVDVGEGVYRIMREETALRLRRLNDTVVIELKHVSPEVMQSLVQEVSRAGETRGVQQRRVVSVDGLSVFVSEGRLVLSGSKKEIERATRMISLLDVPRDRRMDGVDVVYLQHSDAKEVVSSVQAVIGNVPALRGQQITVSADKGTNSLIVSAPFQSGEIVRDIIEKLDIERIQVVVEMVIMEVSEEAMREIGVDWATMDSPSDGVRGFASTNLGPRSSFIGAAEGFFLGAMRASEGGVNIGFILRAAQKNSGVNILSCPNIICSNHSTSKIVVGENRPFVNEARITETVTPINPTVVQGFGYRDVGITLEVTPRVSLNRRDVRLEINSMFTKVVEGSVANLATPVTTKREVATIVTVESDKTVIIGGLIGEDIAHVEKGVPLLKDLPLIGGAFRNRRESRTKTNLILFITPRVQDGSRILDLPF
jgi:general secretion pathway protein D